MIEKLNLCSVKFEMVDVLVLMFLVVLKFKLLLVSVMVGVSGRLLLVVL